MNSYHQTTNNNNNNSSTVLGKALWRVSTRLVLRVTRTWTSKYVSALKSHNRLFNWLHKTHHVLTTQRHIQNNTPPWTHRSEATRISQRWTCVRWWRREASKYVSLSLLSYYSLLFVCSSITNRITQVLHVKFTHSLFFLTKLPYNKQINRFPAIVNSSTSSSLSWRQWPMSSRYVTTHHQMDSSSPQQQQHQTYTTTNPPFNTNKTTTDHFQREPRRHLPT